MFETIYFNQKSQEIIITRSISDNNSIPKQTGSSSNAINQSKVETAPKNNWTQMYREFSIKNSKGSITKEYLISEKSTSVLRSQFQTLLRGKFSIARISL